jgi:hypothetical protein
MTVGRLLAQDAVQRFAKAIGAFPASAGPDVVAVRLDSCPDA